MNIDGNTDMTSVDLGSLTNVDGSVSIDSDTDMTSIDLNSLTTTDGNLSIDGDTAMTSIDLGSLTTVNGDLSIDGDTAMSSIDLNSLTVVGGDETVQAQNSTTSVTAAGSTTVKLFTADAQMTAALAKGTFDHPVSFTVIRLDPTALPPEAGQDSAGTAATIDPLAAYGFNFGISTLGQNATLTFEINVAALSRADRTAFLAALAAGHATVAVKNDAPDSVFRAFAIAGPDQPPSATAVTLVRLDANHNPLPAGSTATPAFVRFDGITGHFSEFAVVMVDPSPGAVVRDRVLEIVGTPGDDQVTVKPHGPREWLVTASFLTAPHVEAFNRADVDSIHIRLEAGNDRAAVDSAVTLPGILDGGPGYDRLRAGGGPTVLLGGGGNDKLIGGANRDILIGGAGPDRLSGRGQDDLLVAGLTSFDGDPAALLAIQAEWTSARDYATRIANILGTGTGPRGNGTVFLTTDGPSATAFEDGAEDILKGGTGRDWFFANLDIGTKDKLVDRLAGEVVSELNVTGP